jgi:hypothetical protein
MQYILLNLQSIWTLVPTVVEADGSVIALARLRFQSDGSEQFWGFRLTLTGEARALQRGAVSISWQIGFEPGLCQTDTRTLLPGAYQHKPS